MDLCDAEGHILSIAPFHLWMLQEMYCAALISAIILLGSLMPWAENKWSRACEPRKAFQRKLGVGNWQVAVSKTNSIAEVEDKALITSWAEAWKSRNFRDF